MRILINAGCNRISIGAQATDNAVLQRLGRRHSAADVFRAVELAVITSYSIHYTKLYDTLHSIGAMPSRTDVTIAHIRSTCASDSTLGVPPPM